MTQRSPRQLQGITERLLEHYRQGNFGDLESLARKAVAGNPANGFFRKALAVALMMQYKGDAAKVLREAAALLPRDGEVWSNLGTVLHRERAFKEAHAAFLAALDIAPDNPVFLTNYGNLLADIGDSVAALAAHDRALAIFPDFAEAHFNRACVLGRAPWHLTAALAGNAAAIRLQPAHLAARSAALCVMNYLPGIDPQQIRAAALDYAAVVRARALAAPLQRPVALPGPADAGRRLRIGLVSGDLREHVVGRALSSVLPCIEREQFALIAYSNSHEEDLRSAEIKAQCDVWRPVAAVGDAALAAQIVADGVDILVDLAGHTRGSRLPVFAWKPAPLQVSWLGYFATTGLAEVDYFVGDDIVMPRHEEAHFVERAWRLSAPYYCLPAPQRQAIGPLPAARRGHLTFACCNALPKLSDATLACWSEILRRVPGSHLLLKTGALADASLRAALSDRLVALGLTQDRFTLEGPSPWEEYLQRLRGVDIALDPFPFPGGATTIDCLALGIPVLTRRGDRFIGHQGETLLAGMGLDDWIANDESDYVARAVAKAGDLPALAALRQSLGERLAGAPIFDGRRLASGISLAWREMWQIRCGGK